MNATGSTSESQARLHASLRTAVSPIARFLNDDAIVEIMLNADGRVWVERVGAGMSPVGTMSREDALRMLRLVATAMNVELSDRSPSLGGKLPLWGARVQASIPPVVEAPVFALRKPARVVFALDDYRRRGILTDQQVALLRTAVADRQNILIGGGTGSGKTTLANALLAQIAESGDRLYLVEDNPELQCKAPNKVQVLVQPPVYTWQRAIVDAMRFRPDGSWWARCGTEAPSRCSRPGTRATREGSRPATRTTRPACSIGCASWSRRSCRSLRASSSRRRSTSASTYAGTPRTRLADL